MTSSLLAISIGPVQDFIAAARKTRDLWFGSYLLSEISKAAAGAIGGEHLIFPSPDALKPGKHVANVILAEVPGDPRQYRDRAQRAAQRRWDDFVVEVYPMVGHYVDPARWKRQVNGPMEFFAAWTPAGGDYRAARREAMRLLAGRKACRDFSAWIGQAGVPKSSLDGARESVWSEDLLALRDGPAAELNRKLERRLRLVAGEQLDLIGVVKRLGGGSRPYPSVSRIAADSWLRGLSAAGLADLRNACEPLAAAGVIGSIDATHPQYSDFPYEGTALFRNRHKEFSKEAGLNEANAADGEALANLKSLGETVHRLEKQGKGVPDPYLAIVSADGDFMGRTIASLGSRDEHREFSKRLSEFATEAESIVPGCQGALVYSGGDDVLAFVPVDLCIACARALHDSFAKHLKRWEALKPSLSAGIAIGHFMEPLEDLLSYARQAEKDAKAAPEKNALAVRLHTRGGAPVQWTASWANRPDAAVAAVTRMYADRRLPDKAAYELKVLGKFYDGWPAEQNAGIQADAARWLKRKHVSKPEPEWASIVEALRDAKSLQETAAMLVIGRKLARNEQQARPPAMAVKA